MLRPPTEGIAKRPLHLIYLLDVSGSMAGEKIASLNRAVDETIRSLKDAHNDNIYATLLVRVITFGARAQWHSGIATPIDTYVWSPVSISGMTPMGAALELAAEQLSVTNMEERGFPPVLILISDGQPTDDFDAGLQKLLKSPWGKRSIRASIAIGDDADIDVLRKFIGNVEIDVLTAKNPEQLAKYLQFVSVAVTQGASSPASQTTIGGSPSTNVVINQQPPQGTGVDVW